MSRGDERIERRDASRSGPRLGVAALLAAALLGASGSAAPAIPFLGSASFVAGGFVDQVGSEAPPVALVSGSFEFRLDDAAAPRTGHLVVEPLAAGAVVGSASFDPSNTEVRLIYTRGVLTQVLWGGVAGGGAHILPLGTDDLAVNFVFGQPFSVAYTQEGSGGRFRSSPPFFLGTLTLLAVPEPRAALLLGAGLLLLGAIAPGRRAV